MLLEENELEAPRPSVAGLAIALVEVERLRRLLLHGRVEDERPVAELKRPLFKTVKQSAADAAPLHGRVDTHPFQLGAVGVASTEGTHSDDLPAVDTHEELATALEIRLGNRVEIVVPRTASTMCARMIERHVV